MSLKAFEVSKLDSKNYGQWRIEIEDAWRAAMLWTIVSDKQIRASDPSKTKEIDDWDERDSKARAIIREMLDDMHFSVSRRRWESKLRVCSFSTRHHLLRWTSRSFLWKANLEPLEGSQAYFSLSQTDEWQGHIVYDGSKGTTELVEYCDSD